MASRKEQKERARQQRLEAERAAAAQAAKRRRLQLLGGLAAVVVVGAVVGVAVASSGGGGGSSTNGSTGPAARLTTAPISTVKGLRPTPSPGPLGFEGVPVPPGPALASTASSATGQSLDGIDCNSTEQLLFHIHSHLTIFVNGSARQIPAGVGIAGGSCLYWLHTHQPDGILHVESPVQRTFTLGTFFDVWGQPLGPDRVGPVVGTVTAFYNGAVYVGDPRNIPLNAHAQIQLDVGTPLIAPENISFSGTGL
jgi:hypothetical protein